MCSILSRLPYASKYILRNSYSVQNREIFRRVALSLQDKRQHKKYIEMSDTQITLPKVVFVLGAPGAGKGTQCANIVKNFGFVHLSAGDLLREERNRPGSQFGELIEKYIRDGQIVPVEITCSLLENAMNKNVQENAKFNFLIDGFPRNQNNLEGWTKQMMEKVQLLFVLFFECSEEDSINRCLKRGEAGSGRSDDNMESLRKRFQTFNNETMPIVHHYEKLNLVKQIDGTQHPDTVFCKVRTLFDKTLQA